MTYGMMDLPPENTSDNLVLDTLGTRLARRRRKALPWVPVVLCGVILVGVIVYQSLQTKQLHFALAEAQLEQEDAQAAAEASRAAEQALETNIAETNKQLAAMEETVKSALTQVSQFSAQAAASHTPEKPPATFGSATDPVRVAELEKLVLFLRDELRAATKTIEQLKSGQALTEPTVMPRLSPTAGKPLPPAGGRNSG